jgi:hypothetical protein
MTGKTGCGYVPGAAARLGVSTAKTLVTSARILAMSGRNTDSWLPVRPIIAEVP